MEAKTYMGKIEQQKEKENKITNDKEGTKE